MKKSMKMLVGMVFVLMLMLSHTSVVYAESEADVQVSGLSEKGQELYDYFKERIKEVATGKEIYTYFRYDYDEDFFNNELATVLSAVLNDDDTQPYLFWSNGYTGALKIEDLETHTYKQMVIYIGITSDYRKANPDPKDVYDRYYTINPEKIAEAQVALNNAQQIVDEAANYSDYEKLRYYARRISELTSYGNSGSAALNMINVFDGDSDTTVVCQGYAIAFHYLCSLTNFNGDIQDYLVTGALYNGDGSGSHMWNNIKMNDGRVYLVDVTTADLDGFEYSWRNPLKDGVNGVVNYATCIAAVADGGSLESGYTVGGSHTYVYDESTINSHSTDLLEYSTKTYSPSTTYYTVTFKANGGTPTPGKQTFVKGEDKKVTKPDDPTKEGYTFEGWYTDADCTTAYDFDNEVTASMTLYAKWTHNAHAGGTATCIKKAVCEKCGVEYGEVDADNHVNTEVRSAKEATCTEEGYTGDTYCKDCKKLVSSGTATTMTEHAWDAGEVTAEATCTANGAKTYTCSDCKTTKTEEIPTTNHLNTEVRDAKAATCIAEGYTGDTYCTDCNTKISEGEVTGKTDHTWDTGKVITAATCTAKGTKTYTCTVCNTTKTEEIPAINHKNTELRNAITVTCTEDGYTGDTYCADCGILISEGEVIKKTGHSLGLRGSKAATCTENGKYADIYCKNCDITISAGGVISKTAHSWDEGTITVQPTETSVGSQTFTCKTCGTTKTEEIAMTGHPNTEVRDAKAATCTTEGYTGDTYCTDCNIKIKSGTVTEIEQSAHTWDTGTVITAATCTDKGIKTYTCTVCNTTKTQEISATGHKKTEQRDFKGATCTEDGYTGDFYCKACGALVSSGAVTNKTGHSWNKGTVTVAATCTAKGTKTYTCTLCKTTKTEAISATGHKNTVRRGKTAATCTEEGSTGDTYCKDCGELISSGTVIAKKAHSWDGGKITVQPTETSTGVKTFTCKSCGTTKTEQIEKLEQQGLTSGKTVTDTSSNGVYKVLEDGMTLEFTKPVSKKTTAKIPNTIKIDGESYKVVSIAANAFKNNTTLKTVSIGKYVTDIGTGAFSGCKKLKKITIKTASLTSKNIGAGAFKGTYAKVTVKVPAKQLKAYQKLLKAKGMSSKAVYKK